MLVLTRIQGQSILIGEDIKLTIVSTKGGQVRLGIEAPPELTVLREEISKQGEKEESAT